MRRQNRNLYRSGYRNQCGGRTATATAVAAATAAAAATATRCRSPFSAALPHGHGDESRSSHRAPSHCLGTGCETRYCELVPEQPLRARVLFCEYASIGKSVIVSCTGARAVLADAAGDATGAFAQPPRKFALASPATSANVTAQARPRVSNPGERKTGNMSEDAVRRNVDDS